MVENIRRFKYLRFFMEKIVRDPHQTTLFIIIHKERFTNPYFKSFKRLYDLPKRYYNDEDFLLIGLRPLITKKKYYHKNGIEVTSLGFNTIEEIIEYCNLSPYQREQHKQKLRLEQMVQHQQKIYEILFKTVGIPQEKFGYI